jgi:ADP-ribose pyrophosphatase
VSTETVFKSRKFFVERRRFEQGGRPRAHDIVVHPGAAVVLPLLDDGRVLMIRNMRPSLGHELLELPAGTLDPGESPEVCAARELQEETGHTAGKLRKLLHFYSSPGIMTERLEAFLATELRPGAQALDGGEQIELAPLPFDEALGKIRDGVITDGKSIAALLYYDRFVRQQGQTA